MAEHPIASGDISTGRQTLTPDEPDSVVIADDPNEVVLITEGAQDTWVTVDGSVPAVDGPKSRRIPGTGSPLIRTLPIPPANTEGQTTVKLLSSGATEYTVEIA